MPRLRPRPFFGCDMKKINMVLTFLCLMTSTVAFSQTAELVWEINDLPNPESVVLDQKRNVLYVSNLYNSSEDSKGSIGILNLDGTVKEKEWVKGLNRPKGIAIYNDKFFVGDVTELVEINLENGEIVRRYAGEGAQFLNDVAINSQGEVFVSDMFTSAIYKLDSKGNFEVAVQDAKLENPNGLLFEGEELLVAAWGPFNDGNPIEAPQGHFLKYNFESQSIQNLSPTAFGNLDGLQKYSDGRYFVSDWKNGDIYLSNEKNEFTRILDLERSAGDILYLPESKMLYVPMAIQGQVKAFKISE